MSERERIHISLLENPATQWKCILLPATISIIIIAAFLIFTPAARGYEYSIYDRKAENLHYGIGAQWHDRILRNRT